MVPPGPVLVAAGFRPVAVAPAPALGAASARPVRSVAARLALAVAESVELLVAVVGSLPTLAVGGRSIRVAVRWGSVPIVVVPTLVAVAVVYLAPLVVVVVDFSSPLVVVVEGGFGTA